MNAPERFRKKPVVIEAMQWDGSLDSITAICEWANVLGEDDPHISYLTARSFGVHDVLIDTLEGPLRAAVGDWIIRGVAGEFYPCKPGIFEATYEPVVPS